MARAARESFPRRNFPPGGSPLPIPELLNLLLHVTVTAWFKPEGRGSASTPEVPPRPHLPLYRDGSLRGL